MPAQAASRFRWLEQKAWIPACAGMTEKKTDFELIPS